jgi:hypothetical protein
VTDDTDDILAGLCLSFFFLFLFTIFDKPFGSSFRRETARFFFPLTVRVYDDGMAGWFLDHIKKMYECASNSQKRETDKRTQVQPYLHR